MTTEEGSSITRPPAALTDIEKSMCSLVDSIFSSRGPMRSEHVAAREHAVELAHPRLLAGEPALPVGHGLGVAVHHLVEAAARLRVGLEEARHVAALGVVAARVVDLGVRGQAPGR